MARIDEILEFWFTAEVDQAALAAQQKKLWWGGGAETDRLIRERFEADVERALGRELTAWSDTSQGRLAQILLLDQFTRSIYRGTPKAFAGDPLALALSQQGIERGDDRELRTLERVFFYMPLMHAEDAAVQEQCVACFRALAQEAEPAIQKIVESDLDFAVRHRDIVVRFGRFPHRNAILGRQPRPEEIEFLKQPGSSF